MFYPEVPLLHGAVVITVIVAFEHGLAALVQRSDKADMVISGTPVLLVEDGRLTPDSHGEDALSREELFGIFRREKIRQLGEVQRAYLEQSGHVSVFVFKGDAARPGLPIVPPWDIEHPETFAAGATVPESGAYACSRCGATVDYRRGDPYNLCPACQNDEWTRARLAPLAS